MYSRALISIMLAAATAGVEAQISTPIKWACIGNSITFGSGATISYPVRLGTKLGTSFTMQNDGVGGTTLLKSGDKPYWTQGLLANVFAFKPDIITIKLGTNDSKAMNWDDSANFIRDYSALIDTLNRISPRPQIWLCLPCPAFKNEANPSTSNIRGSIIKNAVIPRIRAVATTYGLNVIDINTPLANHRELFPDSVHPNDAGADSIASIIYRAFAAKAIRVACIGNSITQYDQTAGNLTIDAYPSKLGMLLGRGYLVRNEGVSGTYLMKQSPSPYWTLGKLPDVFNFKPNIITIKLGTNDSRAQYYNGIRYRADYQAMIDTLSNITSKPALWLVRPIPAWQINGQWPFNGINGNIIRDSVIPTANALAAQNGLSVINAYSPFLTLQSLVADGVHPNKAGQDTLAHILYRALTAPTPVADPEGRKGFGAKRTRLIPMLFPNQAAGTDRLFSLDGKALRASRRGTPAGIYLARPEN